MTRPLPVVVAMLVVCAARPAHATETGIDAGWVVADGELADPFGAVDSLGVGWVRINFRLDAWNSPDDATPHGGSTWFAAYDRIVDAYLARGYQVYALVNDEAVASPAPHGSDAWIHDYVVNAVMIVDHFKDRVRVWEVINEPNDWAGGSEPRFAPRQFAKILQDTYLAVKHDAGHDADRCWQVELVSGPLFSFDGTDASDYLADTYTAGRTELAWDWTHEHTGGYPLDGVGYHVYVAQGTDSSVGDVYAGVTANLGAVRAVVAANDTPKPFWVSEYGFRADAVGDGGQADRLETGFAAMRDAGDVAMAVYFDLRDFPGNAWGVFDENGTRRPSADRLAAVAAANPVARAAAVVGVAAPDLAAGGDGEVIVTLSNRGGSTWTDGVRLGAAPGCPEAAATNELLWQPTDGYANAIADARVFLPHPVAPGESIEVHVPVHAPDAEGDYVFAARMVEEGVAFFGATASVRVHVGPPVPMAAEAPAGSGCAAGGGSGLPTLVLICGVLVVSRRWRRTAR